MTRFFEPINVSATHIYHTALELSPMSSIVRELYYYRHSRNTRSPRVVIGAPEAWNHGVSVSNKDYEYGFCVWSPCSRFVAAQTKDAVEIRDQLTFELLATLQPVETVHLLTGPLAYSPDGRSIACGSNTSIVLWDIQTGGVAKEIQCGLENISMAWSLDGRKIGFINSNKRVRTCDLASGTTISPGKFLSTGNPYFWAHERSFRVLTIVPSGGDLEATVEVLEVGYILTKIYSFTLTCNIESQPDLHISHSPTTCHLAISVNCALHLFRNWNPTPEQLESQNISFHSFSPDGSLFAAVMEEKIRVWKYNDHCYGQWKEFRCPGRTNCCLQFSPTQLSILGSFGTVLHGWRLDDLPATPETSRRRIAGLSRSGNYIITAYDMEPTIKIVDLYSQAPSQSITTGEEIEGLILTDNILLVLGSGRVVAWLFTEEGSVGGVLSGRKAVHNRRLWTVPFPFSEEVVFGAKDHVGFISGRSHTNVFFYHTETGECLQPELGLQIFDRPSKSLQEVSVGRNNLSFHGLFQHSAPPDSSWKISRTAVREGWVKDPEGRHRFWVPVEWRASWDLADWRHDVTTQFNILGGKTVIIKF